jgi:hypothetical protein
MQNVNVVLLCSVCTRGSKPKAPLSRNLVLILMSSLHVAKLPRSLTSIIPMPLEKASPVREAGCVPPKDDPRPLRILPLVSQAKLTQRRNASMLEYTYRKPRGDEPFLDLIQILQIDVLLSPTQVALPKAVLESEPNPGGKKAPVPACGKNRRCC